MPRALAVNVRARGLRLPVRRVVAGRGVRDALAVVVRARLLVLPLAALASTAARSSTDRARYAREMSFVS